MLEAGPDLGLPLSVVVFNRRLKTRLLRGHKHRHDAQTQTPAPHPANDIGMMMRTLKDRVIIKLGLGGQSLVTPMVDEGLLHRTGGNRCGLRPGGDQSPVQRHHIQHFHERTVFDLEPFDDVDLIQFRSIRSHVRKIPTRWRRFAARVTARIKKTMPFENPSDGPDTRYVAEPALAERTLHSGRPRFTQITFLLKVLARLQNQRFHRRRGAIRRLSRSGGLVMPIDPTQTVPLGSFNPPVHGMETHPKTTSDRALAFPSTDSGYHHTAFFFLTTFCAIGVSL